MNARLCFLGLALAMLALAPPASAQYMFLDANGDGVFTNADKLHPVGATTIDVWLDTAHNRNGSATSCTSDPTFTLEMFSYVVNLKATNGTVAYSSFTNRMPGFFDLGGFLGGGDTEFSTGGHAVFFPARLPPGKYLLCTLAVTVATGSPAVEIVPYLTSGEITGFGSGCPGSDLANTMILGTDWFDVDGVARPGNKKGAIAPNPINPSGKLSFATDREGAARIRVFDIHGRIIRTLLDTPSLNVGSHVVTFDGNDDRGGRLSSGIYYYRVESTAGTFEGRIVVLK